MATELFNLSAKLGLDDSSFNSGLDKAEGKAGSFGSKLKTGMKAAAGTITAVGAGAVALGKKFTDAAKETAAYGDTIDKASQKMGLSTDAYQKWDFVLQQNGANISSLKVGMKKLSAAAQSNSEDFKKLGISEAEVKNLSQEDLFSKVISGLQGMEQGTERTTIASNLLGKSAIEMGALLNQSAEDTEKLKKQAEDYGFVMSEKTVKASARWTDSLNLLSQTTTGLKNKFMGEFLPSLSDVTDGLAKLFTGDTSGLENIKQGVDGLISKFTEMLPKVMEIGGGIIEALTTAIVDNMPKLFELAVDLVLKFVDYAVQELPTLVNVVIQGIITIANAIGKALPKLIPTIVQAVMTIANLLVENLPTLISALITIIEGLIQGILDALPMFIEMLPTLIENIINALIEALPILIEGLISLIQMIVDALPDIINAIIEALPTIIEAIINGLVTALPQLIEGLIQLIMAIVDALPKIIVALIEALPRIIEAVVNGLINALPQLIDGIIKLVMMLVEHLPEIILGLVEAAPKIIEALVNAIIDALPMLIEGAITLVVELVKHLPEIIWGLIKAIPKIIESIVKAFGSIGGKMLEVGKNLVKGLWDGIISAGKWLWDMISGFFGGIIDWVKGIFGIKSPSKVFAGIGKFLDEGLALGIDENANVAIKASSDLADDVINQLDEPFDVGVNDYRGTTVGGKINDIANGGIQHRMVIDVDDDGTQFSRYLSKYLKIVEKEVTPV